MPLDLQSLKTLLASGADPSGTRYAPYFALPSDATPGAGNDELCAALLNNVHPTATVPREPVPLDKLVMRLRPQDLAPGQGLGALNTLLGFLATGSGAVDLADAEVFASVVAFFVPGSITADRLTAWRLRRASVAEALFGRGVVVTAQDIGRARQEG